MTGPEHYKQAEQLLARAEEVMLKQGPTAPEPTTRGVSLLLQAAAAHVGLAQVAATVQTGRMPLEPGRAWEAVLVVPANFAEAAYGESW